MRLSISCRLRFGYEFSKASFSLPLDPLCPLTIREHRTRFQHGVARLPFISGQPNPRPCDGALYREHGAPLEDSVRQRL